MLTTYVFWTSFWQFVTLSLLLADVFGEKRVISGSLVVLCVCSQMPHRGIHLLSKWSGLCFSKAS